MRTRPSHFLLLFLAAATISRAVPKQDFGQAAKSFQQSEESKQLWLKPDVKKGSKGDFVARLQKEAAEGNKESQATLALCYHIGFGIARDQAKAIEWYQKAADAGHPGAQNNLGSFYDSGLGVPEDHEKAQALYLAAANQGFAEAQFNVAHNYAHGIAVPQDWEQARLWYEKAAAQGHLSALNNLGNIYLLGQGVPVDFDEARKYLQKPADAGLAASQFNLSATYSGKRDFTGAAPWLRRSAVGGYPGGQFYWAAALAEGAGVEKNPTEALKWARLALKTVPTALPKMTAQTQCLTARLILGDKPSLPRGQATEAFHLASAAADTGFADGQHLVGICYQRGIGVDHNWATAEKWYRLAAEQKHIYAASSLASLLEQAKNGVVPDPVEAARWQRVAAEGGVAVCQYRLGIILRDGIGVEKNPTEALKWLRLSQSSFPTDASLQSAISVIERQTKKEGYALAKQAGALAQASLDKGESPSAEAIALFTQAADLGEPQAIAHLARIYHQGRGVPPDEARANALLAKIADTSDPKLLYFIAKIYLPIGAALPTNDIERAVPYLQRSAAQGYGPAENALGYYYMSSRQPDLVEAFKWLTLSAAQGIKDAQINLDRLRPAINATQIEEGSRRASHFQPTHGVPPAPSTTPPPASSQATTDALK